MSVSLAPLALILPQPKPPPPSQTHSPYATSTLLILILAAATPGLTSNKPSVLGAATRPPCSSCSSPSHAAPSWTGGTLPSPLPHLASQAVAPPTISFTACLSAALFPFRSFSQCSSLPPSHLFAPFSAQRLRADIYPPPPTHLPLYSPNSDRCRWPPRLPQRMFASIRANISRHTPGFSASQLQAHFSRLHFCSPTPPGILSGPPLATTGDTHFVHGVCPHLKF